MTNERVASLEQVLRRTLGFAQRASSVPGVSRRGMMVTQGSNKSDSRGRSGRICVVEHGEGEAKGRPFSREIELRGIEGGIEPTICYG